MGKLLKIFLSVIAVVFLLIIMAAIALPLFFNPNDFKPQIEAAVQDKIGRELNIVGDLELSLFPWLGLSTGKITVLNPPGFQDKVFAQVDNGAVKVKLVPLLSKHLEIDRIVLEGLSINFIKNAQGEANVGFLRLSSSKNEAPAAATKNAKTRKFEVLGALAIAGITLKNARVDWDDQQAGHHLQIKALNFTTDALAFDKPIAVNLDFILENPNAKLSESVNLSTVLSVNEKLDHFMLTPIDLTTHTETQILPGGVLDTTIKAQVNLDLAAQQLNISGLTISAGDLHIAADITGTALNNDPVFVGPVNIMPVNLAQLLRQWHIELPPMPAADALSALSARFNLQASATAADLQDLIVQLDASTLKGSVRVDHFTQPGIDFNLSIDTLDLDRYLAPDNQPDIAGQTVVSPASAVAAGASLFPVEMLNKLDVNGLLSIAQLKVRNLIMQHVALKLAAKDGAVNTEQTVKDLYQGSYSGNSSLNVRTPQPVLNMNEKFSNVQVEPLLQDLKGEPGRITGRVDAAARLRATGNSTLALTSSLNGQLNFVFKDSVVKGFNLQQIIDDAKSIIKGAPLVTDNPKDQTAFSEIKGSAAVIDGLIINKDLVAHSSKLRVNGEGRADLKTQHLDYHLNARLIKAKATATEPEQVSKMPVLVNISGTFEQPVYTLDIAAMLLEQNKDKLEQKKERLLEKLDKKLEKKLGPGGASELLKRFF